MPNSQIDPQAVERARLACLRNLNILDTQADERIDKITRITAAHFDVPIALVSLVDEDRQWFKSRVGLDAQETPRCDAFCSHTIEQESTMIVRNALEDGRFAQNPLVLNAPNIRFYAGAPIIIDQTYKIGTLCLIDRKPRDFSQADEVKLKSLARSIQVLISQIYSSRDALARLVQATGAPQS